MISGNDNSGIFLFFTGCTGNIVRGNIIGLQADGNTVVSGSPQGYGVNFSTLSGRNIIGGTTAGSGNVISGNDNAGIYSSSANTNGNEFYGNIIGLQDDASTWVTSNSQGYGFQLATSHNNIIGGSTSNHRNIVAGNSNRQIIIDPTYISGGTSHDNVIHGNYIGIGSDGISYVGGTQFLGVELGGGCYNNYIGGTNAGQGNVVSGMSTSGGSDCCGIWEYSNSTSSNYILGNIIGSAADGVSEVTGKPGGAIRYQEVPIGIYGGINTVIHGNVIQDGAYDGIQVYYNVLYSPYQVTYGLTITGNYIGVASDGSSCISANSQDNGIGFYGTSSKRAYGCTIGGTGAGEGNVISGNGGTNYAAGIYFDQYNHSHTIIGNIIGPQGDGNTYLNANQDYGIYLDGSYDNVIGGSTSSHRNIISANSIYGIHLTGSTCTGNQVKGNYIGIAGNGTSIVSNATQSHGIYVTSSANSNIIGGSVTGEANVVSGNRATLTTTDGQGIYINSTHTSGNTIIGNIIGLQADGLTYLTKNQQYGINLSNSKNNIIGGSASSWRNTISGNRRRGINMAGSSTGNIVYGNYFGLTKNGTGYITSTQQDFGIWLVSGATYNQIGGSNPGEGNVFSGQGTGNGAGIRMASDYNTVYGNMFGPLPDGVTSATNNVQDYGIWLEGNDNTIGGTTSGMRNIFSGNRTVGMVLTSSGCHDNLIRGNYIGIAGDGDSEMSVSTQDYGIYIQSSAYDNIIGGTNPGEGNVISAQGDGGGDEGYGVYFDVSAGDNNQFYGNIIGPQDDGSTVVSGNQQDYGVYIDGASDQVIGGSTSGHTNVISANNIYGVYITGASATSNTIHGNYIGVSSSGTSVIASSSQDNGIYVASGVPGLTIGGTNSGEGNVISGNSGGYGIYLLNDDNEVYGNIIGPGSDGTTGLSGGQTRGIMIDDASDNIIGGSSSAYRNVISGHDGGATAGVYIDGATSTGNRIKGNIIGLQSNGTTYFAGLAQTFGVFLNAGSNNIVGGTKSGEGNVISGNTTDGINIGSNSNYNEVYGNIVGPQIDGSTLVASSNQGTGVDLGSSYNIVGGSTAGHRNVISGNTGQGITLTSTSTGNIIKGNYIGLASNGTSIITGASQDVGISAATPYDTQIGGTAAGEGNVISGNDDGSGGGIGIWGILSHTTAIEGNIIGLQSDGASYLASNGQEYGIQMILHCHNTTIGGSTRSHRNVISGNEAYGISIAGASSADNVIQGNYIGPASDGTSFVTSSTQEYGIYLESDVPSMVIGGTNSGEGNLISGNGDGGGSNSFGIYIQNDGHEIYGNTIGPRASGTTALDATNNQNHGIFITGGADNIIGGTTSGHRNVISDNIGNGITITGAGSTGNAIKGNYIGIAADGNTFITSNSQNNGISFTSDVSENVIGGTTAAERNVISGNSSIGLVIGSGSHDNYVYGNIIGPQKDGDTYVTNNAQLIGIYVGAVFGTPDNVIGSSAGVKQIISGNESVGIYLGTTASTGNSIVANYIGPASDGSSGLAGSDSQDNGIMLVQANNNQIGSTAGTGSSNPDGNVITQNTDNGIFINDAQASGNMISKNLIFSNTNKAIDLNSAGNANYAAPGIGTAYTSTTVWGTAAANDIIDVFKKVAGGTNHCQQAQVYLGTTTANGSGNWTFSPGGTILNAGDTPLATARSSTNNNTSEFACPSTAVGLPVELLTFTAEKQSSTSVITKWTTATEINNDYFTLERSTNGIDFPDIEIVSGAGNSSTPINYNYLDEELPNDPQILYYRLKQTDFDGTSSYSQIEAVDFTNNSTTISIYPNPTDGSIINVVTNYNNAFVLVVRDALGRKVFAKQYSSSKVNLHQDVNLSAGIYGIIVQTERGSTTQKLVVR